MNPSPKLDVIIVLGSANTNERKFRAIAAGYTLSQNLTKNLLLSGGKTGDESKAKSMLLTITKEFPKARVANIYLEEKSTDTSTKFENSLNFIKQNKWDKIGILVSRYHKSRAAKLAKAYGIYGEFLLTEDLLYEYNKKFEKELRDHYKTGNMKNIIMLEMMLNGLLLLDTKGRITKKTAQLYYNFSNSSK